MAANVVADLKARADAALVSLRRQLEGMEPYLERADAPGEWTAREVLSHLLGAAHWEAAAFLRSFARTNLPVLDLDPGTHYMTDERRRMLEDFLAGLDSQRAQSSPTWTRYRKRIRRRRASRLRRSGADEIDPVYSAPCSATLERHAGSSPRSASRRYAP